MHPILTLPISTTPGSTKASSITFPEEAKLVDLLASKESAPENEVTFSAIFDVTAEKLLPKTAAEPLTEKATLPSPDSDEGSIKSASGEVARTETLTPAQVNPDDTEGHIVQRSPLDTVPQKTSSIEPSTHREIQTRNQAALEPKNNAVVLQSAQKNVGFAPTTTIENVALVHPQGHAKAALDAPLPIAQEAPKAISQQPNTFVQTSSMVVHPPAKQSEHPQSALLSLQAKNTAQTHQAETTLPLANRVTPINAQEISKLPIPMSAAIQPSSTPQTQRNRLGSDHPEQMPTVSFTAAKATLTAPPQWNTIQPLSKVAPTEALKTSAALDVDPLAVSRSETTSTATSTTAMPIRTDTPHHMARQIAEALQHMPNRPVEITLSPKELGRVRLGVSTSEGNIMVSVLAERPETTDLMRRHISTLETAFQELGYSDISFSFAGGNDAPADAEDHAQGKADTSSLPIPDSAETEIAHLHLNAAPVSGVDIRL